MTSVARTKRFQALVRDFVSTAAELGCAVRPDVVAAALETRISVVAAQLGMSEQTVLRTYLDDGWGRDMARDVCRELVAERAALVAGEDGLELPAGGVARLVAGLGQALLYFSANELTVDQVPGAFSVREASEAVTGLGLALAVSSPGAATVTVAGNVVAWARDALRVFSDNLEQRRWSSCPCGDNHGQRRTDAAVLRVVKTDLRLLDQWTAASRSRKTPPDSPEPGQLQPLHR